jgi:hypothetical protein
LLTIPSQGDFCGSTYIDRNFEELLRLRLGQHYQNLRVEMQQRIIKNFEDVKCAFRDNEDQDTYNVSVPTLNTIPEAGIIDGEFMVSRFVNPHLHVWGRGLMFVSGEQRGDEGSVRSNSGPDFSVD